MGEQLPDGRWTATMERDPESDYHRAYDPTHGHDGTHGPAIEQFMGEVGDTGWADRVTVTARRFVHETVMDTHTAVAATGPSGLAGTPALRKAAFKAAKKLLPAAKPRRLANAIDTGDVTSLPVDEQTVVTNLLATFNRESSPVTLAELVAGLAEAAGFDVDVSNAEVTVINPKRGRNSVRWDACYSPESAEVDRRMYTTGLFRVTDPLHCWTVLRNLMEN
jgi:hypothetical protein